MSSKTRKSASKTKPAPATETSESIADQTEAFLKSGGMIEKVDRGVSGQATVTGGRRHITITSGKS